MRARGWKWREEEVKSDQYMGPDSKIPDDIHETDDAITTKVLRCESSGKPYKVIPQELKFYRRMGIPVPRTCPDERHKRRMSRRNARTLYERACDHCKKDILTTYAPERPEIVYCERCFLETVY